MFGELLAVGSAFCLSANSILMTIIGKRFGSVVAVRGMVTIAFFIATCLHLVLVGLPDLTIFPVEQVIYLMLAGVLAFSFGAVASMMAFVRIGPRLTSLVVALGPIFSSIFAFFIFGEALTLMEMVGIALTLGGIMFVVTEPDKDLDVGTEAIGSRDYWLGVFFAFCAAILQSLILILNRKGLATPIEPITAIWIRLIAGFAVLWVMTIAQKQVIFSLKTLATSPTGLGFLSLSSILGPNMNVFLILSALQLAPVGIVSTLSNLKPIILIPLGYLIFNEHITRRATVGTFVAVTGTVIIFL
ncbi:DMT family transporter [Phototrophicus methaneseepsis]|uniref:DMT family transporter n=1 Tax=Phototrophicus methaneseepsis TaxID=2710758 RepID=A0A7S8EDD7_9CHLR|nr:DMT family transporter [Phototrophicus methaneseepsis]QPC84918.1 DMT family transporter [Phototrophicus methaneseepsis]